MTMAKTTQPMQDQIGRYKKAVEAHCDQQGAQAAKKTKSRIPTLQQNVLLQLNHGGWILKGSAALKRDFGVEDPDDWFFVKPRVMHVTAARQIGEQILINFEADVGVETITVPFRVKMCDALRSEVPKLIEPFPEFLKQIRTLRIRNHKYKEIIPNGTYA